MKLLETVSLLSIHFKYKRGSLALPRLYFCKIRQDLNPPVAARTSAARNGSTERNNHFPHSGKCKSSPVARTTILRQSNFADCRIFFCFSEHLSILRNTSHHEGVTAAGSLASANSAVLSPSGWLPPYAQRNKVPSNV